MGGWPGDWSTLPANNQTSAQYINAMRQDGAWVEGPIVDVAIPLMLDIQLSILELSSSVDGINEINLMTFNPTATQGTLGLQLKASKHSPHYDALPLMSDLFVSRVVIKSGLDAHYQALVNSRLQSSLSDALPLINALTKKQPSEKVSDNVAFSQKEEMTIDVPSREMLVHSLMRYEMHQMFTSLPRQLSNLSSQVVQKPYIVKGDRSCYLLNDTTTSQLTLRGEDIQKELSAMKSEMPQIELDSTENIGTIASWLWWMLPTILTLGVVGIKKAYADEYKKNLVKVNHFMNNKQYQEAATILKNEFARWNLADFIQLGFLSAEYYIMGHLLNAICAEEARDIDKAIDEYNLVIKAATNAQTSFNVFIVQIHLLHLLRSSKNTFTLDSFSEVNAIVLDLNVNHSRLIADIYWALQEQMMRLSKKFLTRESLSEADIAMANYFLTTDVLFLLDHFSKGRGEFFKLYSVFFQGATLAFFAKENTNYLWEETKIKLMEEVKHNKILNLEILNLAINKVNDCVQQLNAFKCNHTELKNEKWVADAIGLIESFVMNYFALSSLETENRSFEAEYLHIAKQLGFEKTAPSLLQQKENILTFLAELCEEFQVTCTTPNEWLDLFRTTTNPNLRRISAKTGDTMLHRLVDFPGMLAGFPEIHDEKTRIMRVIHQLKDLKYVRNHEHKTLFYNLKPHDPLNIQALLSAVDPVAEFKEIITLLNQLKTNNKQPFILLSGLDLDGKKSAIVQHIKNLNFKWTELTSKHDISRSFENIRTEVKKNAQQNTMPWNVLFISNLELIFPEESNNKQSCISDLVDMVAELTYSKVIIIGITEHLEQCDSLVMDLAINQSIEYTLPTREERLQKLNYLLREKKIAQKAIERLADILLGYSSHKLKMFVDTMNINTINDDQLETYLRNYNVRIQKQFNQEFSSGEELVLPNYQNKNNIGVLYSQNNELHELQTCIQNQKYKSSMKHTLLLGACPLERKMIASVLAQLSGYALISVQMSTMKNIPSFIQNIFRARKFEKVIIFINDLGAVEPSVLAQGLIQELFELTKHENTLIMGGAETLQKLVPIFARYTSNQISCDVSLLHRLEEAFSTYLPQYPYTLYADATLMQEIKTDAPTLNKKLNDFSGNQVNDLILFILQNLSQYKPDYSGFISLRLKDITFFIDKILSKKASMSRDVMTHLKINHAHIYLNDMTPQHILINDAFTLTEEDNVQKELDNQYIFESILDKLNDDFDLSFTSVNEWLDAIIQNPQWFVDRISTTTGDTLLHVLVTMPVTETDLDEAVACAAELLKHHCYVRNHQDETPFALIPPLDLHHFRQTLPLSVIKMGEELNRVEKFLDKIKANPSVESHFLLLDGPPGGGKTTAVLDHIRNQGYTVHEWINGETNDRYVNQVQARVKEFFENAEMKATKDNMQVLFMDEIHGVLPSVEGKVIAGHHDKAADVAAILQLITALKNKFVVLIGATNYPNRLEPAVISRAADNRIYFPLPTASQRLELLIHFFREKKIKLTVIESLATVAIGYSIRQLQSFADQFTDKNLNISLEELRSHFNLYSASLRKDFAKDFDGATLFMPCFESRTEDDSLLLSPELEELMFRLRDTDLKEYCNHALLYGPPGNGKTKAVEIFAKQLGRVLIAIQADEQTKKSTVLDIFTKAKQFENAIIFFDEMDRIAGRGASLTSLLQTEMDGITSNAITIIGASNHQHMFSKEMLSRLTQIYVPPKTKEELNGLIRQFLLVKIASYKGGMYFSPALNNAMQEDSSLLATLAEGLDLRQSKTAMYTFIDDLCREPKGVSGITYLRVQDIFFTFLIKKIEINLRPRPEKSKTCRQYIQENRQSFFPNVIPEGSVRVSEVESSMGHDVPFAITL